MADESPLGQKSEYVDSYSPSLLHPLPRRVGQFDGLGEDLWLAYEFSWLNPRGKPEVGAVRIQVDPVSPCIVESKSMKLYLGSYAQSSFATRAEVEKTLGQDLTVGFGAPVQVALLDISELPPTTSGMDGRCLDTLNITIETYRPDQDLLALRASASLTEETLYSHLFRSLCPVTGQPDWASVMVQYRGAAIDDASLLKYLISYRQHGAYHESTIEQIFLDILAACRPERLSVYGRFQRRGGIDINPFRSTHETRAPDYRLLRQ